MAHTINLQVAGRLEETAGLLRDQGADSYRVVITAARGSLAGWRVVAGRAAECQAHYAGNAPERMAS
jgi:hypothetical protein